MVVIVQEQWGKALLYNSKAGSPICMNNIEPYAEAISLQLEMFLGIHTKMELFIIWEHRERGRKLAVVDGTREIAMPAIGAGLGGGNWNDIKRMISEVASNHPSVDLYVVEQYKDVDINICYIRKEWEEEHTLYYLHFVGDEAVRQIEIMPDKTIYLSIYQPIYGDFLLYDQSIKTLELSAMDYITKNEFEEKWYHQYRYPLY